MQTALSYRTNRDLFSNHYLNEHLPETEAWDELSEDELREAKDDIMELWEREKETAPKRNESQLEEKFIRPMFRKLGIPFEVEESTSRTQRRPDYGFFESDDAARGAFERREEGGDFYKDAVAVADAKRWGRPFDTRGSGEHERDFENPSYQIHVYLQETPARWAVLTDGKKWRLYYGPTSHRLDSYYEIDLPTVLEKGDLEDFKYFYLFFRHGAFLEGSSGECFLDEVYDESNVFAQELGEDLQDNIYEAIKVLSGGFMQYPDNDLSEDDLDLVHDSSLIYLYRLIFVLYAESEGRDLLDTNNEIYEESYSLNTLKQDVAEELDSPNPKYRDWQDNLWDRLDELFKLIDQGSKSRGIPEEDLYIPAYNGGLFRTDPDEDDSVEARFLANHQVGDAYLAEVIELLTRSQNGNGEGKIFVDYSSLDVRHLGSIYEGLLEYQLDVADEPLALENGEYVSAGEGDEVIVEEGEVHLSTGSGERKATGSYYTPEYVVEYIVEETLGPLVDDIRSSLVGQSAFDEGGFAEEFAEEVFDLKILDPAMGSGHFLTSAIDYLAREIIDAQERQAAQQGIETVNEEHDINWARRQVAQRCIYGVDLNPLAVELAKVSLWLRTLAAEQPLAFLDHHLKAGNSLVGSDIEEIEELESDAGGGGQNATLADFGVARKGTIEQLMRIYQDFIAIENQDLADVKEMEAKYDKFERNKLRQRLEAMANVHTAEKFGLDNLPSDAYERMAAAMEDDDEWAKIEQMQWFQHTQKWAEQDRYFHWRIEYPEIFYDDDGSERNSPGFDAVIGNPPWVRSINLKADDDSLWKYYKENYESAAKGEYDIYLCFIENGLSLLTETGEFGYIVPNKWFTSQVGENLRSLLVQEGNLEQLVNFGSRQLFEGITTYSCLLFMDTGGNEQVNIWELDEENTNAQFPLPNQAGEWDYGTIDIDSLGSDPWSFDIGPIGEIFDGLSDYPSLGSVANIFQGIGTRADPVFLLKEKDGNLYSEELEESVELERDILRSAIKGTDIDRYGFESHRQLIFPYEIGSDVNLLSGDTIQTQYPKTWDYLCRVKEQLEQREGGKYENTDTWYQYGRPQNMERSGDPKVVIPDVVDEATAAFDEKGQHILDTVYGVESNKHDHRFLTAILNSDLLSAFLNHSGTDLRGGYFRMKTAYLNPFPVPDIEYFGEQDEIPEEIGSNIEAHASGESENRLSTDNEDKLQYQIICKAIELRTDYTKRLSELNLNILDYLGKYGSGEALGDLSGYQPPGGVSDSILYHTSETKENLRIGKVETRKEGSSVIVLASARYKPEDEDEFETDQWGYTETDLKPAIKFIGLDETTAAIIQEFVPVAVDEAGGFAGFRETATKTNSLIDRLEALTIPDPHSIESDLNRYLNTKEQAEELEARIQRVDALTRRVLFDLYGLTENEIDQIDQSLND